MFIYNQINKIKMNKKQIQRNKKYKIKYNERRKDIKQKKEKEEKKFKFKNKKIYKSGKLNNLIIILLLFISSRSNKNIQRIIILLSSYIKLKVNSDGISKIFYDGRDPACSNPPPNPDKVKINGLEQSNINYHYDLNKGDNITLNYIGIMKLIQLNACFLIVIICQKLIYLILIQN